MTDPQTKEEPKQKAKVTSVSLYEKQEKKLPKLVRILSGKTGEPFNGSKVIRWLIDNADVDSTPPVR